MMNENLYDSMYVGEDTPKTMPIEWALYMSIPQQKTVNDLIERICDHFYIYRNRSRFSTWAAPMRDAICRDAMFFDEPEYEHDLWLGQDMRCRRPMYHNLKRTVTEMLKDIPEATDGYDVEDFDQLLKVICKQGRVIYKHNVKMNFKAKLHGDEGVVQL